MAIDGNSLTRANINLSLGDSVWNNEALLIESKQIQTRLPYLGDSTWKYLKQGEEIEISIHMPFPRSEICVSRLKTLINGYHCEQEGHPKPILGLVRASGIVLDSNPNYIEISFVDSKDIVIRVTNYIIRCFLIRYVNNFRVNGFVCNEETPTSLNKWKDKRNHTRRRRSKCQGQGKDSRTRNLERDLKHGV